MNWLYQNFCAVMQGYTAFVWWALAWAWFLFGWASKLVVSWWIAGWWMKRRPEPGQ